MIASKDALHVILLFNVWLVIPTQIGTYLTVASVMKGILRIKLSIKLIVLNVLINALNAQVKQSVRHV